MLAERGERLERIGRSRSSVRWKSSPRTARISTVSAGPTTRTASWIWPRISCARADQLLTTNSVVQDHYGDVLLRLGRCGGSDRRLEPRADRRRRLNRSQRHRPEDPRRAPEAAARSMKSAPAATLLAALLVRVLRRADHEAAGRARGARCPMAPRPSTQATRTCRGISSLTAEIGVSGSVAGAAPPRRGCSPGWRRRLPLASRPSPSASRSSSSSRAAPSRRCC